MVPTNAATGPLLAVSLARPQEDCTLVETLLPVRPGAIYQILHSIC
jgi:hypothetical protein